MPLGSDSPRYNTVYKWSNVQFSLDWFTPYEDQCRKFLMEIIDQAVRDFINLRNSTVPIEKLYHTTAHAMIFDDDYRVDYGGQELSFEDILDVFDTDITWFRERTLRKLKETIEKKRRKNK